MDFGAPGDFQQGGQAIESRRIARQGQGPSRMGVRMRLVRFKVSEGSRQSERERIRSRRQLAHQRSAGRLADETGDP